MYIKFHRKFNPDPTIRLGLKVKPNEISYIPIDWHHGFIVHGGVWYWDQQKWDDFMKSGSAHIMEILLDLSRLYEQALSAHNDLQYVSAQGLFERVLAADPGGELGDNAQYWIGECEFGKKNNFDTIISLQPIAGFGDKKLTEQEVVNSFFQ